MNRKLSLKLTLTSYSINFYTDGKSFRAYNSNTASRAQIMTGTLYNKKSGTAKSDFNIVSSDISTTQSTTSFTLILDSSDITC